MENELQGGLILNSLKFIVTHLNVHEVWVRNIAEHISIFQFSSTRGTLCSESTFVDCFKRWNNYCEMCFFPLEKLNLECLELNFDKDM